MIIAIDQMRGDYPSRFQPLLSGGLGRLMREGLHFSNAHQDHAITNTAPGHASIATGSSPRRTGIISNEWYDRIEKRTVYCVDDEDSPLVRSSDAPGWWDRRWPGASPQGRSPKNLQTSALPDWIRHAFPGSRTFAASYKDRSAILLGGRNADAAYWYDAKEGEFVSSRHYMSEQPEWVKAFHARRIVDQHFGSLWDSLPLPSDAAASLSIEPVNLGWFESGFPHAIGSASPSPDWSFYDSFARTPFIDFYVAEFAKALVENEGLGQDEIPDYLGVSFSALDLIGHRYGPNSPEVLDAVLRLDQYLGDLLSYLDEKVGADRVLLALSSDHGVADLPEYRRAHGLAGHRWGGADTACLQRQSREAAVALGISSWSLDGFYLDQRAIVGAGGIARAAEVVASKLSECDCISRVWTRSELESRGEDPIQALYFNSFHAQRSPDLFLQLREHDLSSGGYGSSHGTPYRYDTHVPILLKAPGLSPGVIEDRVRTIDIAATLARMLGVQPLSEIDGDDLSPLFP